MFTEMSTAELVQIVLTVSNLLMTGMIAYYRLSIKELRMSISLLIAQSRNEVMDEVRLHFVTTELFNEKLEHRDTMRQGLADRLDRLESKGAGK